MLITEITTYTDDQGRQITRAGPGQKVISKSDDTGTTRYDASGKPVKQISPRVGGLQKTTDLKTGKTTTNIDTTIQGVGVNQTKVDGKVTNTGLKSGGMSTSTGIDSKTGKSFATIGYQISDPKGTNARMDVDTRNPIKQNIAQLNKLRNVGK